jgi:hypothetical protein
MSITLSPVLDLILSLVSFYYGLRLLHDDHELLGTGYFMVSAAAFIGFFDMGGMHELRWIHDFLSAIARLMGTLAMGLGVVALLMGQRKQRYAGYILAIFGPVITYYFYEIFRGPLQGLYLWSGCIFLIAVLALAVKLWLAGNIRYAILSISGILLTAFVGLFLSTVPHDLFLRPVDIMHISLMLSYTAIYYSVVAYAKVVKI